MNSQSLQECFPDIYKDFFNKCFLVVSAPSTFFWIGEHAVMYGICPAITQKLPFRLYVGLEPNGDKQVELGGLITFLPYQQKFSQRTYFNQFIASKLLNILSQYISGVKIYILSEFMPSCGLNSSGAFAVALAVAINLYHRKISSQCLNEWQHIKIDDLIKISEFDNIFRLAWTIDAVFHADSSSGSGPFGSLMNSSYPIIFFTEERNGTFEHHQSSQPLNVQGHYEAFDHIKYWGYRMDELLKLNSLHQSWSIDFGLIYSGNIKDTGEVIHSSVQAKENLNKCFKFIKKLFSPLQKYDRTSLFIKNIHEYYDYTCYWKQYLTTLMVTAISFFRSLEQIFQKGLSHQTSQELFRNMNRYQENLRLLNVSSPLLDEIIFNINANIKDFGLSSEDLGIKLTGGGMGGDLLFAAPLGKLRSNTDYLISLLQKRVHNDIHLDYASWLDGYGSEGVKIEQDLICGIQSDFVAGKVTKIKTWFNDCKPVINYIAVEKLYSVKESIELLINCRGNFIYIRGKRLTSDEIHSSAATISVLKILLENIGQSVSNQILPNNSYSHDRNEMQGKIIIPLKKIVGKITGKELPLTIKGGITHFTMKMEKVSLKIVVAE